MLDIQKIIDKITRIKKLKMKSFEIIFDELDEVISELLDMKKEIEEIERKKANDNSDSNHSLKTDDVKAITDSDDETEEETLLREALEKIIEFKIKIKISKNLKI